MKTKHTYEFYTESNQGIETIVSTKKLVAPKRSIEYKKLEKQGFINDIKCYGFRLISNI